MPQISALRIAAKSEPAQQVMIIFHGLGDSGQGWSFLADMLQRNPEFSKTRFIFPNAPVLSITANGGFPMPAWFNIYSWDDKIKEVDSKGLTASLRIVESLVDEQIKSGIKPEDIIVGGFSQGAALTLSSALTLPVKIGGFLALSGFGGFENRLENHLLKNMNNSTPIFQGHGELDPVVSLNRAKSVHTNLTNDFGFADYTFKLYPGLAHSTSPDEIWDVVSFIKRVFRLG